MESAPRGHEFLTCGIRDWATGKLKTCRHGREARIAPNTPDCDPFSSLQQQFQIAASLWIPVAEFAGQRLQAGPRLWHLRLVGAGKIAAWMVEIPVNLMDRLLSFRRERPQPLLKSPRVGYGKLQFYFVHSLFLQPGKKPAINEPVE